MASQNPTQADNKDKEIVYLNIKTTGFGNDLRIIQISARHETSVFNVYIHPRSRIPRKVTKMTGFQLYRNNLFWNGRLKRTTVCRRAFIRFLRFLEKFGSVILVAHNALCFHANILLNMVERLGLLDLFNKVVYGFVDTLPLIREALPNRKAEKKSFKFIDLVEDYCQSTYGINNAVHDTRMLKEVIEKLNIDKSRVTQKCKTTYSVMRSRDIAKIRKENLITLQPLSDILNINLMKRLASNNITLEFLINVLIQKGPDHFYNFCKENVNRRPRITKNDETITLIIERIKMLSNTQQSRSC